MKRIVGISVFFFYSLQASECNQAPVSSTVFLPQTISASLSLETALHSFKAAYKGGGAGGTAKGKRPWLLIDGSIFYFQSFDAAAQAADFMPNGQATIIVGQNNTSNLSAPWIGIVAPLTDPFESQLTFSPFRQVTGSTFKLYVDFGALFPDIDTVLKDLWTTLYIPVTYVRHNLNLKETIISGEGASLGFANATQALNSNAYSFGKPSANILQVAAFDDMQYRLGWNFCKQKKLLMNMYGVLFIPLGRRATAEYLFEPVVGWGGHWSLGAGIASSHVLYQQPWGGYSIIWELRWNYYLEGVERRTIDLYNGNWSRFLLVSSINDTITPLPGVNFFTRDVDVTPRNSVDLLIALNYSREQLTVEFGYDLWWKQRELVVLPTNSQPIAFAVQTFAAVTPPGQSIQTVIYDISGCCPKTSLSQATICQSVPGPNSLPSDALPIPITNSDLNLASCTKLGIIYMKFYTGFSYTGEKYPLTLGLCASCEFVSPTNSLKQLGVWMKGGYSF